MRLYVRIYVSVCVVCVCVCVRARACVCVQVVRAVHGEGDRHDCLHATGALDLEMLAHAGALACECFPASVHCL